jgi:hypothetical protein
MVRIKAIEKQFISSLAKLTNTSCDRRLSRIKSPFLGPGSVLVLTGIRRIMVQIKATEKEDLLPLAPCRPSPDRHLHTPPKISAASERRWNHSNFVKVFYLKAKAIIWP